MPDDTHPCEDSLPGTMVMWRRPQESSHDDAALNNMLSASSPKIHDIIRLSVTGHLSKPITAGAQQLVTHLRSRVETVVSCVGCVADRDKSVQPGVTLSETRHYSTP